MKSLIFILTVAALLSLSACGNKNIPENTNPDKNNSVVDDAGDAIKDVGDGVVDGVEDMGEGVKDGLDEMTGNDKNDSTDNKISFKLTSYIRYTQTVERRIRFENKLDHLKMTARKRFDLYRRGKL